LTPSIGPTRLLLHFAITPGCPDQFGCITARQPFVARLAPLWQRDFHDFPVESFGSVMANGCTQILQISARATSVTSFLSVGATCLTIHIAEHLCAPPVVQSLDPLFKLAYSRNGIRISAINVETITKLFELSIQVNRENVRDRDIVDVPHAPLRSVFGCYIFL
jgi:hypothetical protein